MKGGIAMQLVIAEKPSVGRSVASVIGATEKKDGYLEGNGYIVTWCIGHLVQLASPIPNTVLKFQNGVFQRSRFFLNTGNLLFPQQQNNSFK